jgi:dephospho-CoA kinase
VDRKRLAKIVFSDEQARQRLNAITHPRVRALAQARFDELEACGEPLGCYEAALLFENGLADALRPVVVVSASAAACVARVMARDGCTEPQARARLLSQLPLADKLKRADFVIDNDGPLELTHGRTDAVLQAVCAALGVDGSRYRLPG